MAADPLATLTAEVVSHDDALRKRIAAFVSKVLDQAEYLLENGNPKAKGDLISKLIPHLVRQMSEQAEDESIAAMRAEMKAMFAEMRATPSAVLPPAPEPDIPTDEPAPVPTKKSPKSTSVRVSRKSSS